MKDFTRSHSGFYEALLKLRSSLVKLIAKVVDPLSPIGAILWFAGVDFANRYSAVSKELVGGSILEIGSGGQSALSLKGFIVISVDILPIKGVDVVASATHLPFKKGVFNNVISVDTLEHIPDNLRKQALLEMMRVTNEKVIVHCPLQRENDFMGRSCDLSLKEWLNKVHGGSYNFIDEHINNVEPSPELFTDLGFAVCGIANANLWIKYQTLNFLHPKLSVVCRLLAWSYFLINKSKNMNLPFWGAICIYTKNCSNH